jgi:hypothetical protein
VIKARLKRLAELREEQSVSGLFAVGLSLSLSSTRLQLARLDIGGLYHGATAPRRVMLEMDFALFNAVWSDT